MLGILPSIRDIFDDSHGLWLFSDSRGYTPNSLESSTTSQLQLHLPEVWSPAQYLIDVGLRPALARRLSSTYIGVVNQYRNICQSHFDRATHGGGHLIEYYREVFIILFKRTVQSWGSQIISIARVQLCQAGALRVTVCSERVDIRVDGATKAEIIARLGLKDTHFTSDTVVTSPSTDEALRLEKISEQSHTFSKDRVDSRLMSSDLSPVSSTDVTSRPLDPFCQPSPPTCFPAPYPPPPEHSLSYSPQRALATSFVLPVPPPNVRSLTGYKPDVSSLTDLFGRMTVTTLKTGSANPKCHRMFGISGPNKIEPILSPVAANCSKEPQLESTALPPKSTTTARRRKIVSLPTRRAKTPAFSSPSLSDTAGATSHPITPRPTERVVEKTPPVYGFASPQKTRPMLTLLSPYNVEAPYIAISKASTPGQRKVHTLYKTLPQSQTIPQNQAFAPRAAAGGRSSYTASRSPLVSDATSYFDSPPTSSDELDTPPSTPPSSHVLLASASTESLTVSSEADGIVSHKEPLSNAKLPYPRLRYRRLDFTKGGLGRDEQPLTFTF